MGHKTLNPDFDKEYWDFSFIEMAEHDDVAMIEYILEVTDLEKITYVGHSQGTSQMFYGISTYQDYWKEKLNLFVALAPVVRLDHSKNDIVQELCQNYKLIEFGFHSIGRYFLFGQMAHETSKIACGILPSLYLFGEGFLITSNPGAEDPDRFQVYMA